MGSILRGETFVAKVMGRFVVFVHDKESPPEPDWDKVLDLYRSLPNLRQMRSIVITEGAAPDAAQRKRLNEVLGGFKYPASIVTSSAFVRAVVTALRWFMPEMSAFAPGDETKMFDHVGASQHEREMLRAGIAELRAAFASLRAPHAA